MQKYKIGDYVMYGVTGACEIVAIGTLDFGKPDKEYYSLKPVYSDRDTIYVPLEKEDEIIRKVIDKKQAQAVLDDIKERVSQEVDCDREEWDEILKSSKNNDVVSMILKLREIRRENKKNHKMMNISDAKVLSYAERILFSEMAIALGLSMDDAFEKLDPMLG